MCVGFLLEEWRVESLDKRRQQNRRQAQNSKRERRLNFNPKPKPTILYMRFVEESIVPKS